MLTPWLRLRRIRQRATLRSEERREMEAYLRARGVFETSSVFFFKSFVHTWSAVGALAILLMVGVSSYAYASDDVLPNTPLYPVRQVLEQVETKLAVTPVQKDQVQRKLIERRKQEVQKLKALKKPVPVEIERQIHRELRREFIQDRRTRARGAATSTEIIATSTSRGVRLHQEIDQRTHNREPHRELRFTTSTISTPKLAPDAEKSKNRGRNAERSARQPRVRTRQQDDLKNQR